LTVPVQQLVLEHSGHAVAYQCSTCMVYLSADHVTCNAFSTVCIYTYNLWNSRGSIIKVADSDLETWYRESKQLFNLLLLLLLLLFNSYTNTQKN